MFDMRSLVQNERDGDPAVTSELIPVGAPIASLASLRVSVIGSPVFMATFLKT